MRRGLAQQAATFCLAALLAALACFEHALHLHAPSACCSIEASDDGRACAHQHVSAGNHGHAHSAHHPSAHHHSVHSHAAHRRTGDEAPGQRGAGTKDPDPPRHDPDRCPVCRFLALTPLWENPGDPLETDLSIRRQAPVVSLLAPSAVATYVPIRGPPAYGFG